MYKDEGINLSNQWLHSLSQLDKQRYELQVDENQDNVIVENERDEQDINAKSEANITTDQIEDQNDCIDSDDDWNKVEEQPAGTTDTLYI